MDNKNVEKLFLEIIKTLKPIIAKYYFLNISNDDINYFVLDKINKNINKLDDTKSFTRFVRNKFLEKVQKLTQEILEDKQQFINVVNEHLKKFNSPSNIKTANIYLSNLSDFLTIFNCNLDLEVITSLINNNNSLKTGLQVVIDKYDSKYRYVVEDAIILSFLEAYCVMSNIEFEDVDILDDEDEELSQYDLQKIHSTSKIGDEEYYSDDLFREIMVKTTKVPLLTQDEQKELLKRVAAGDQLAREKLYERNQRLVIKIAKQYQNKGLSMLDLFQEGSIGLMTAIDRFDINKDTKLSTYATWWIRQAITRAIAESSKTIRVPVHIIEKRNKIDRVGRQMTIELGREPTVQELAKKLKMSEKKLIEVYEADKQMVSLNVTIGDDNDTELGDLIGSDEISMDSQLIENNKISEVITLLSKANLNEREIDIILRRYGLVDGHTMTLQNIADIYSITRERVRQIENKALKKLRNSPHTRSLASYMENPNEALENLDKYKSVYYSSFSNKKNIDEQSFNTGRIIKVKEDRTIYEYLSDFSKENINDLINQLPPLSRDLIRIRFGEDLENPKVNSTWNDQHYRRFQKLLIYMKRLLSNPNYKFHNKPIYNYFPKYDSLEVDFAIATLSDEERELLAFKFGNDLHFPVYNIDWEYDSNNDVKFSDILEKISKILPEKNQTRKRNVSTNSVSNIYDYYHEFDKCRVDLIISLLTPEELELVKLKFGEELNEYYPRPNCLGEDSKKLSYLLSRLRYRLSNEKYGKKYTFYELIPDYTKEEIDLAITFIKDKTEKEIINRLVHNGIQTGEDKKLLNSLVKSLVKTIKEIRNIGIQPTIYEYFNQYTKECVDYALAGLTQSEIELLHLKFGDDFEVAFLKAKLTNGQKKLINLLLAKMDNQLNQIKNKKKILMIDIYDYFGEFSKELIDEVLSQLDESEMSLLKMKFGDRLTLYSRNGDFTKEQEAKYRYLMIKIRKKLNNPKTTKKSNKKEEIKISIYEYFKDYDTEEINYMLSKLSENDLEILHQKFGENLDCLIKKVHWDKDSQKKYTYLYLKMQRLLKNVREENHKADSKKSIYDYYTEYTVEEINSMLSKLNEVEIELLKKKFGKNLECFVKRVDWQNEESKKYIVLSAKIKRLLKNPNSQKREKKSKEKIKISIYDYFSPFSIEEVNNMLSKLNNNEIEILHKKFGLGLDNLIKRVNWSKEEQKNYLALYYKMQRILKNPNRVIRKQKIEEQIKISIYDYFKNYTTEEVNTMLSKLSEIELKTLKKKFGEGLDNLVKRVNWNADEHKRYIALYSKMTRLLKNPTPKLREKKIQEKPVVQISIYEYFKDYTIDEINVMLSKLSIQELNILHKKFGENLDFLVKRVNWDNEESKKYVSLYIKMRRLLKNPNSKERKKKSIQKQQFNMNIYDYFEGYAKDEIDFMISKLKDEEIVLLHKKFGENLECYSRVVDWQDEESKKYKALYAKMNRYLKNPIPKTKENKINEKPVIKISIYDYFRNYTYEEVNVMLAKLNETELEILHKKFGENLDSLVKRVQWTNKEHKEYIALYSKMYRLLKNPSSKIRQKEITEDIKISIYDYFRNYTYEEVNIMLAKLNEAELEVLHKKFGENLDSLIKRVNWSEDEHKRYIALYAKMQRLLKNPSPKIREKKINEKTVVKTSIYEYFKDYSMEEVEKILIENSYVKNDAIRVNTLKTTKDEVIEYFKNNNIPYSVSSETENGIVIYENITNLDIFKKGFVTIQDISSQMVSEVLNPSLDSAVLDVCSAPGGKTSHLASIMKNTGKIFACDIYEHKLKLMKNNFARLGVTNVRTELVDARNIKNHVKEESFDYILADVPCSGLGVISHKVDLKYKVEINNINDIVKLQKEILDITKYLVKKGGFYVYSTCTINKDENERQIERFLKENCDFEKVFEKKILPFENHTDGFYICKLKRK